MTLRAALTRAPVRIAAALLVATLSLGGTVALWPDAPSTAVAASAERSSWRAALASARGTAEGEALRASALAEIDSAASDAIRADAIELLGFVGDDRDVDLLVALIDDGSHPVAAAAVEALGRIGGDRAVEVLAPIARARDPYLGYAAYHALGATGHPAAVDILTEALATGRDVDYAAPAIARIGTPEAADALIDAYEGASQQTAWPIATALASFANDVPAARQALRRGLDDRRQWVRSASTSALAQANDPELFTLLEEALATGDATRQAEIAQALGQMRDERAIDLLVELARNGHMTARSSAIWSLSSIGGPEAEAALVQLVLLAPADVASQAAWAMPMPPSATAVEALLDGYELRPVAVRQAVAARLLQGPWPTDGVPPGVVELARQQVRDGGWQAAPEAWKVLLASGDLDDEQLFRDALDATAGWQKANAVAALAGADQPWARKLLLELARDPDPSVAQAAVEAVLQGDAGMRRDLERVLLDRLDEGGANWAAEQGLVRLGTPRALMAVFDRIADGTDAEAQGAISAIGSWGDAEAIAQLGGLLDEIENPMRRQAVYGALLYRSDVDVTAIAEQALAEEDASIRSMATSALSMAGTPRSRDLLLDLVHDDDPSVRSSALYALGNLGGPDVEALALELMEDPTVAPTALATLSQMGTRTAREVILTTARDGDTPEIRTQAIYLLAQNPGPAAQDILIDALEDDSSSVRMAAISSLQSSGGKRAAEALAGMLDADPDDPERWSEATQAAWALRGMGGAVSQDHQERIDEILGTPVDNYALYGELGYLGYQAHDSQPWVDYTSSPYAPVFEGDEDYELVEPPLEGDYADDYEDEPSYEDEYAEYEDELGYEDEYEDAYEDELGYEDEYADDAGAWNGGDDVQTYENTGDLGSLGDALFSGDLAAYGELIEPG